jgi:hypothetical protein
MVEDGGSLLVIDPTSGQVLSEKKVGRIMFGSLLYGDGKIYCGEATGNFWIFKPTDDRLEELCRVRLRGEEILSSPVIWGGRVYLATTAALYCIGPGSPQLAADAVPEPAAEAAGAAGDAVAHIQIVPVEALAAPGETIRYRVLGFDAMGRSIGPVAAEYQITGAGSIEADGQLAIPTGRDHYAISVTAKAGDLASTARVRVVPRLPWTFDFNDRQVPVTWIGAAYRHQPFDLQGESVLVKVTTIPKGTRSQCWMGHTHWHDYTIRADFCSTGDASRRADMGLINQRYTLDLMGKDQLQIRSWTPRLELRFARTIPFTWEANRWYGMKFQSENRDDGVVLRGKVWQRDQPEPAAWTVEATDATPNRQGSPGLFGNSTVAEFYIDNVAVVPNDSVDVLERGANQ